MVVDMKTVSWEVHPVITGTTEETVVSGDELPAEPEVNISCNKI